MKFQSSERSVMPSEPWSCVCWGLFQPTSASAKAAPIRSRKPAKKPSTSNMPDAVNEFRGTMVFSPLH